jgi:hypothetical protein
LITDWGDHGHHQYLPVSYTGIFAGAALSWRSKALKAEDVASAINEMVFHDEAGDLGRLLLEIGRVCELVTKRFYNCTVFNRLLFSDIGAERVLKGVTAASLKKCIARFDELADEIGTTRPQAADGSLVKAELLNAIAMARCGAERGLAGLDRRYFDRAILRHALQGVISQHEQLWLARNRPGGLNDSSARLRAQLQPLA